MIKKKPLDPGSNPGNPKFSFLFINAAFNLLTLKRPFKSGLNI